MKMIISGDANREDMIELMKFLRKRFQGRKEHLNVFVKKGTEDMSMKEVVNMFNEIWEEKLWKS